MNAPLIVRIALTLLVLVAIVIASVVPGKIRPGDGVFVWIVAITPTLVQKILHVAAYAGLAALLMWTLERITPLAARIGVTLALTVITGAALEWYQTFVPGRFGSLADVLLNAGGAVLGLLVAAFVL
jgi:hypothetical protein